MGTENMQKLNFRSRVADDAEAIFEVMEKAFRVENSISAYSQFP
jgi:hypothetical protein